MSAVKRGEKPRMQNKNESNACPGPKNSNRGRKREKVSQINHYGIKRKKKKTQRKAKEGGDNQSAFKDLEWAMGG